MSQHARPHAARKLLCLLHLIVALVLPSLLHVHAAQRIYIQPDYVALNPYARQQFTLYQVNDDGTHAPVTSPILWLCTPAGCTISQNGLLNAGGVPGLYPGGVKAVVADMQMIASATVELFEPFAGEGYYCSRHWGSLGNEQFREASMDVDAAGNIAIADRTFHRIQEYGQDLRFRRQFGGIFTLPKMTRIARSTGGTFVLGRESYPPLIKVDSSGATVFSWDSSSGDSRLQRVSALATDAAGNVYVGDSDLDAVKKFGPAGNHLATWGKSGGLIDAFQNPVDIALDSDGNMYVADAELGNIQKISPLGYRLARWGSFGEAPDQFVSLDAIAVDPSGVLYALDATGGIIRKFTLAGEYLGSMPVPSQHTLDIDFGGASLYALDPAQGMLVRLDGSGETTATLTSDSNYGHLRSPHGVAVAPSGEVVVADTDRDRIQVFDEFGRFLRRWGSSGSGPGQFKAPQSVAVDGDGLVYVADTGNGRIQKFTGQGQPCDWQEPHLADVCAVAVGPSGHIYAATGSSPELREYTASGDFIRTFGQAGAGSVYVSNSVATSPDGFIYTVEYAGSSTTHGIVRKYREDGQEVLNWPVYDTAPSWYPLGEALSIAVKHDGNVVVGGVCGLEVYSPAGEWITSIRECGTFLTGRISRARGIAAAADGTIYVADPSSSWITRLSPELNAYSASEVRLKCEPGGLVVLSDQIVTSTSTGAAPAVYMEAQDRSSGIRVAGVESARDMKVQVSGVLRENNGEVEILSRTFWQTGQGSVNPLHVRSCALGGGQCGLQPAVWGWSDGPSGKTWGPMQGLNNVGLLVSTSGRVVSVDAVARTLVLDDGSGRPMKCIAPLNSTLNPAWSFATVTGISSVEKAGEELHSVVRVRTAEDIVAF